MQYILNDNEKARLKTALENIEIETNKLKRYLSSTEDKNLKTNCNNSIKVVLEKLEDIKKMNLK